MVKSIQVKITEGRNTGRPRLITRGGGEREKGRGREKEKGERKLDENSNLLKPEQITADKQRDVNQIKPLPSFPLDSGCSAHRSNLPMFSSISFISWRVDSSCFTNAKARPNTAVSKQLGKSSGQEASLSTFGFLPSSIRLYYSYAN